MSTTLRNADVLFNDSSTQGTAGFTGFRNRIINGNMVIDQRNSGAAGNGGPAGVVYTVDRFAVLTQSGSGHIFQQISDAPAGFSSSLRITIGTGATPTSTQQNSVFQPIEGFNVADFDFGTAGATTFTASFLVKSSIGGTYSAWFQNGASTRAYIETFTINSANTWEFKTLTIPGDTSGTWLKTNGVGMFMGISLGVGSTFQTTAGAWTAGDFKGAAGSVNLVATSGATFQITGVQLEAGSVATPFERRPVGTELALCQRYFAFLANPLFRQRVTASGFHNIPILFPTTMRATPSVVISDITSNEGTSFAPELNTDVGYLSWDCPSTGTANIKFSYSASAEL